MTSIVAYHESHYVGVLDMSGVIFVTSVLRWIVPEVTDASRDHFVLFSMTTSLGVEVRLRPIS